MKIFKTIENEISSYLQDSVEISENYSFSTWKLIKRLLIYLNKHYPEGKEDSQGNYKYWFDIITPRVDAEVKNIDFDTKDILPYTDPPSMADMTPLFLTNAKLRRWLRDTGQGVKINDAIEDGSSWGNVLWKKIKGGYEQCDLVNTYIINQTARTVDETPVIERHEMSQSDLRAKKGVWNSDAVENVILECGKKSRSKKKDMVSTPEEQETEMPIYEIYERNGEVSVADLKEAQGIKEKGKDDDKQYVLAKIVVAGLRLATSDKKDQEKILYADKLTGKMSDIYKEYHRGRYMGRWWRAGIPELLFDIQTRVNKLGNQIAEGMEYALKVILNSGEKKIIQQNVLTDMLNGDIIGGELKQVLMQIPGLVGATEEWNRMMVLADKICNSYEVVQGESLPSGTPFRLGALLNQNANKLFDFLREKLGLALEGVIGEWIIPDLISDLKTQEVMELSGDQEFMDRYFQTIAKAWYRKNLLQIGPHTKEQADLLIQSKVQELRDRPISLVKYEKEMFVGFKPKVKVVITGENMRLAQNVESWGNLIKFETDPVRRSAMLEQLGALVLPEVDIAGLPKSPPMPMQPNKLNMAPAGAEPNAQV